MKKAWKGYQEEAAAFFRSLGMAADTDVEVQGVRTTHAIDVLVKTEYAGFDIKWLVECKRWKTKVSKSHVLTLREIVADVGADRGILLAEAGFQSGASEAAHLTNVQLTSLAELRDSAESQIYAMRLADLFDRIQLCRARYWAIDKSDRIQYGLRPDVGATGLQGDHLIKCSEELVTKAMRGTYPIEADYFCQALYGLPDSLSSVSDLYALVDNWITDLEGRLTSAERAISRR